MRFGAGVTFTNGFYDMRSAVYFEKPAEKYPHFIEQGSCLGWPPYGTGARFRDTTPPTPGGSTPWHTNAHSSAYQAGHTMAVTRLTVTSWTARDTPLLPS